MKKFFLISLLPFFLNACDNIGTTRTKNLIDLTPKLEIESEKNHLFFSGKENPFNGEKNNSYKISKNTIIAEPAIAKGVIYSIDKQGYVSAFSLKEKKILWVKDIAGNEVDRHFNSGGILFSNGKLYVTYGTRNLVAIEADNGNEIIRKEFPDILRTKPIMANDSLLIAQTISNQTIAYNIKTSKLVWMHEGGIETISSKNHIHPMVYNGHILVSYSSGEVVYLNANTGTEVWRYNLTNMDDVGLPSFDPSVIITKPIIHNNFVYFATSNGKIVKLSLERGETSWVKVAQDVQTMVLHDNNLIVTNNARQVAALSTTNGKVYWVGDLISPKERAGKKPKPALFLDPFVVKDGNTYTLNIPASNGELYKFTRDENGHLPKLPLIINIDKGVRYYWISCCNGKIHLISNAKVKF